MPTQTARVAPPVSKTQTWDKAKWHYEADVFPEELTPRDGAAHIRAALEFLQQVGQLTADGREELKLAGDDVCLLDEHVKPAGRAFLDRAYVPYLEGVTYVRPPQIKPLKAAWADFSKRYDVSKRPVSKRPVSKRRVLNPYQALLRQHSVGSLMELLWKRRDAKPRGLTPESLADLTPLAQYLPAADGRLLAAAEFVLQPGLRKRAAKYAAWRELFRVLGLIGDDQLILEVTADLLRRAGRKEDGALLWRAAADTLNEAVDTRPATWAKVAARDRAVLSAAINQLFVFGLNKNSRDYETALCAMRIVGDARSLELIAEHPKHRYEGTAVTRERGKWVEEPFCDHIRREAVKKIKARLRAKAKFKTKTKKA